ncbi:MAG: hydrogenase subunit EhbF [Candidatus Methanofastidiosum methylothiophilum]|uniref:Hydrogenase subunit EhbF n=1 Tax=Candidatus Methanofastidiosum methylothiophilum TaxID=1705564 RepID=A0A150IUJ8_9EURY|nr:MAG: hydrogenase subunit EhbF [Candidatus Methanofastidiosum methylthiophilus]KYC48558.1 MAG: hydrogenase subunit EhbF [Candidatus Methanofastidiosum methylthiophilus]KYC51272.1 MAG: hydrogenase subunit EhbF [Candidatus Methanofastidiosum methylthiophilus]
MLNNSTLIPLMVVLPLIMAILVNFLHQKDKSVKFISIVSLIVFVFIPVVTLYGVHLFSGHLRTGSFPEVSKILIPEVYMGIVYSYGAVQKILMVVLTILTGFSVLAVINKKMISGVYMAMIFISLAASSAIILADDIFNFFVFTEILVVAQAALVIAVQEAKSFKAAFKYMIFGTISGASILLGIALLLGSYGLLNITDLSHAIQAGGALTPIGLVAVALLTLGWLYESGLFPFHIIKSNIYENARPEISALLQVQSKFVLVAMALILFRVFSGYALLKSVILGFAIFTVVIGSVMALQQVELRKLLSFVAVSQAGLVAVGFGLGTPFGIAAGIFHAINDVLSMAILFFIASFVYDKFKTTKLDELGEGLQVVPLVGFVMLLATLAISGVPPFNSYQSEWRLIQASAQAGVPELGILVILLSVATFVAIIKAFYMIFMKPGSKVEVNKEVRGNLTKAIIVILILACLLIGLFPNMVYDPIYNFVVSLGV